MPIDWWGATMPLGNWLNELEPVPSWSFALPSKDFYKTWLVLLGQVQPKKPKGLGLGLGFQFFGYLSFEYGFGCFCKLRIRKFKYKKNFLFFGYGFEYRKTCMFVSRANGHHLSFEQNYSDWRMLR